MRVGPGSHRSGDVGCCFFFAPVLRLITELSDLRPGSITGTIRRCGKPTCHCARASDPGHGPNLRLTFKTEGKTVTEALPTPSAVRKAEREIEEFASFRN